jgi:phospholipid/cholesterol/gamma-HCH transport system permease protein
MDSRHAQINHAARLVVPALSWEDALSLGPQLVSRLRDGRLELAAAGSWTASHAKILEPLVEAVVGQAQQAHAAAIDMAAVEAFDTYGAWLLERLTRAWAARGGEMEVLALPDRYRGLLEEVHRANRAARAVPPAGNRALLALEAVGRGTAELGRDLVVFLEMLGAIAHALVGVLQRPRTLRITSIVHHLDRVGWQAVPIVLLITFLIGGIIAQQGFFHFRKFGADEYVVDMVGILVLREIGVLIVAIMVAGRSGSSYTAELGSMKMREEIDALRTMGFDPVDVLILPRVLALVIALPLLTFLGSMAALYGGGLVAWLYGGMSPEIFTARLREAISVTHFEVGMIKAPFMALAIGVVACSEGLRVKGSAESLGRQTTTSVVKSIFLVIVLDGLFAMFFASIGM